MAKYLIDTSILINHLRGDEQAIALLKQPLDFIVSFVTLAELIQGVRNKAEMKTAKELVSVFPVEWGSGKTPKVAVELLERFCLDHGLRMLDALQAAVALTTDSILVTDNLKHFHYIPGLVVEPPYSLVKE